METRTTKTDSDLAAARLMVKAATLGLDWAIVWQDAPGEPAAFRLDGAVIGETESDALDCISLAAASLPKKRARSGRKS